MADERMEFMRGLVRMDALQHALMERCLESDEPCLMPDTRESQSAP